CLTVHSTLGDSRDETSISNSVCLQVSPLAPSVSGRRCPSCGSSVRPTQNFCAQCGGALVPGVVVKPSSRFQTLLGKGVVGLFIIVLLLGMAKQLLSPNDKEPTGVPSSTSSLID